MNVGHTGTRNKLPQAQDEALKAALELLRRAGFIHAHSGDCLGSDRCFHEHAVQSGFTTHGHLPQDDALRAFCTYDHEYPPKTHFARNRDIVDNSRLLTVCPRLMEEEDRGGTWYTAGYARKKKKPIWIIWPDGTATQENWVDLKTLVQQTL